MPSILPGTFGALVIGAWVNAGLYTIELQQVWYLFTHYKDRFAIRMAVVLSLLSDTVGTAAGFAATYLYLVTHWGDASYLERQWWPVPTYVYTLGITAGIVQVFLIYRFWALNYIITIALSATALVAFVSIVVAGTWLIRFPSLKDRYIVRVPGMMWFVSSAVSDVAVAVALVWQLQRQKVSFRSSQSLISHLSAVAMKSGSVCAATVLVIMSCYLQNNESLIAIGFSFCCGRVYSLTMLYNLNTRIRGQRMSRGAHTTGDFVDGTIHLSDIQMQRSAHIDNNAQEIAGAMGTERKISDEVYYVANRAAPFAQS